MRDSPIPDEGVELDGLDIVKSLESGLDLPLVGLDVDNEDKGVVLLDHLHGALGVERVDDDLGGIEARLTRDAPAGVGRGARELEGLREVEGGAGADLADLVRVDLILREQNKAVSDAGAHTPLRGVLTPLRVALAAALALAEGLEAVGAEKC